MYVTEFVKYNVVICYGYIRTVRGTFPEVDYVLALGTEFNGYHYSTVEPVYYGHLG